MEKNLRETMIDVIGKVPWGTHFCQFYQTGEDLISILVPYFKAGLENNEFCMWVTSEALNEIAAENSLKKAIPDFNEYKKKGQMEIIPYTEWYLKDGHFDSKRVLNGWIDKLNNALAKGFEGLRLTGNTIWLEKKDWESFARYEEEVNGVIGNYRIIAICTYSLDKCSTSEIIDVINNHQFAVIKRYGKWNVVESFKNKKTEDSLQKSEAQLKTAQRIARLGSWELDLTTDILIWSDEVFHIFEIDKKQFDASYETFLNLVHPDDRAMVNKAYTDSLKNKMPYEITHRLKFPDGRIKYVNERCETMYSEKGEPVISVGAVQDITEQKKEENMLRESNNFSQSLLQTIPFGMDIIDEKGNILFINQNLENLLGKEVIGKKCWDIYKDDKKQCANCPLIRGIRISETETIETECVLGGKTVQITHTGMIYRNKKAILEIFEDITERKQAEQKIKHLASFPKLNPKPVLELDLSGKIIFYNQTCLKILEDLEIQRDISVFVPDDIQEIIKSLMGRGVNSIYKEIKIGDKTFKEDIFFVPQFDTLRIYADDITELQRAGEILKTENLRLQELDRKKTEFISIVAHDLRTPLTSIMGFADTVMKKKLNLTEEQENIYIGYIQEESRRLSRLISNYLDISNIEEGKFDLNIRKTDLGQVIADTVKMFTTNNKDILISSELESDLPGLKLDQDRIKQVLQNLIGNAIKYSPKKSAVSVSVSQSLTEIRISINDQGPGIPDAEKEKIFQKFYRINTGRPRIESGTGLGLAITKSIVERHSGKIWVEDNSPSGSRFIFTLPVNK